VRYAALAAALGIALASCGLLGKPDKPGAEALLAQAGFTRSVADTPHKLSQFRTLPQRQMMPYSKGGTTFYVYADADGCRCAYQGDEKAYRRYVKAGGAP
jgi:hypothetical protein